MPNVGTKFLVLLAATLIVFLPFLPLPCISVLPTTCAYCMHYGRVNSAQMGGGASPQNWTCQQMYLERLFGEGNPEQSSYLFAIFSCEK